MKVKDIIISALNIIGRNDIITTLNKGTPLVGEAGETVNTLLYCFNATEDELARKYLPLTYREEIASPDGEYYYAAFIYPPVKIKRVLSDGEEIKFELFTEYMAANSKKITVEYEYAPVKKKIDGNSDYGAEVSEYLLALGTVSEYCLINGEIESAELWEARYRKQIDLAQNKQLPAGGRIPPRRWI